MTHYTSNTETLHYEMDGRTAEIYQPIYNSGMYLVTIDKVEMGYLYISYVDEDLEQPVWVASTTFVEAHLEQLSKFIESSHQHAPEGQKQMGGEGQQQIGSGGQPHDATEGKSHSADSF